MQLRTKAKLVFWIGIWFAPLYLLLCWCSDFYDRQVLNIMIKLKERGVS